MLYAGHYDKRWYDVKLHTGEVVRDCWPNAGMFNHSVDEDYPDGRVIPGSQVEFTRKTNDPIWRSIDKSRAIEKKLTKILTGVFYKGATAGLKYPQVAEPDEDYLRGRVADVVKILKEKKS